MRMELWLALVFLLSSTLPVLFLVVGLFHYDSVGEFFSSWTDALSAFLVVPIAFAFAWWVFCAQLQDIPFFKQVILMAFACDYCGYKNTEVKPSGQIGERGRKTTLR